MSDALVLGIETSCDETAIGIVRGRKLLANVIASSVQEHARFGGVVPEVASRAHLEAMQPALKEAITQVRWVAGAETFAMVVGSAAGRETYSCLPTWGGECNLPIGKIIELRSLILK